MQLSGCRSAPCYVAVTATPVGVGVLDDPWTLPSPHPAGRRFYYTPITIHRGRAFFGSSPMVYPFILLLVFALRKLCAVVLFLHAEQHADAGQNQQHTDAAEQQRTEAARNRQGKALAVDDVDYLGRGVVIKYG